jgi:hypothetical protein
MITKDKTRGTIHLTQFGFKGIRGDIEDELLPDGYLADIKNLTIEKQTGVLQSIAQPTLLGQIASAPVKQIFLWQKDDSTSLLLAQAGDTLYYYNGGWTSINTFSTNETVSMISGMMDKMYVLHPTDGLYSYDGTSFTSITTAPKGKYMELWYNRLFIAGGMNDGSYVPYRVRWSAINDPTTWGANDFIDFRTPENSQITGIKAYKQVLYVSTASSVHVVNVNFSNYKVYSGKVTPVDNQIAILNGFYYVSSDGVYALQNGDIPAKLSMAFDKYFSPNPPQSITAFDGKIYYLSNNNIMVYDVQTGVFTRLVYDSMNVLYSADHLYMGTSDGYVYELDVPTAGYLQWSVKTPVHNFNRPDLMKSPREMIIYWHSDETSSFDVNAYFDYASTPKLLTTIEYTPGGAVWGSFVWGEADWTAADTSIKKTNFFVNQGLVRTMQVEITGSNQVNIYGYSIIARPFMRVGR